jgi:chromosome partitioning protein
MALVITLAHQKGGVGKTTLTLNLYDHFVRSGTRCAIVDADVQGSIVDLYETLGGQEDWGELDIIGRDAFRDFSELEALEGYDVLFIDTPPYLSAQLPEIFQASDFILVPCKPSPLDALAIKNTLEMVREAQRRKPGLKAGIVLNMTISGTDFNQQTRQSLKGYGVPVLAAEVGNRVAYSRSLFLSRSVAGERNAKATEEIAAVAAEIVEHLNGK